MFGSLSSSDMDVSLLASLNSNLVACFRVSKVSIGTFGLKLKNLHIENYHQ